MDIRHAYFYYAENKVRVEFITVHKTKPFK